MDRSCATVWRGGKTSARWPLGERPRGWYCLCGITPQLADKAAQIIVVVGGAAHPLQPGSNVEVAGTGTGMLQWYHTATSVT